MFGEGTKEKERSEAVIFENLRNQSGFWTGHFFRLLFGGNQSTFHRRSKVVICEHLRNQSGFWKGHFLGYCLEEISLRFREEVRLSFVRIWGISPCFEGAFLRLLLEGSVRVLKGHFGTAVRMISPGFWNRILGFLQGWSIQVFEMVFWGCCKGDQSGFLKEHFGATIRVISSGFWKSILGLL